MRDETLLILGTQSNRQARPWVAAACVAALAGAVAPAARAETLADALALAYQSNPTLQSQRALQRQLDETYVQARAGFRPTVSASSSTGYSETPAANGVGYTSRTSTGVNLAASQPLYTGGRVAGAVDAAEATVLAGRQGLRNTEQTVLQQVVQAYQDVLRDQQILAIRQQSVTVLDNQLVETRARFEVGLLTRTDVARAEAQVAASRALLAAAQAQLQNSRANYATAVGQNPGELVPPAPLAGLPANVDEAFRVAEAENPTLQRAQIAEQASRYRVAQVRAQRNPTVALTGSAGFSGPFDPLDLAHSVAIAGVVTQPIFTGGVISSQIRAALEQNNSDRILIEQARRTTVQSVALAWNQMQAAIAGVVSNREQVRAATVAFEGVQEQFQVGLSTTLDVLLTQETLRSAQLSLVQAEHDVYVAQGTLLSAMGRLDARNLVQGVPLYDANRNFQQVKYAGAVPWESLVESLDQIGRPANADRNTPLTAPAAASGSIALNPARTVPSGDEGFSTVTPTLPAPGTTSPAIPSTLGDKPGPSGALAPPAPRDAPL
ncbi:MAG TPA: TolC family outer membrane protein [Caulobacteraceae bacterium]|nr:TolC family outer membrane protein [Caulobacteraceae bacterium]